jgi:hypothetical protein
MLEMNFMVAGQQIGQPGLRRVRASGGSTPQIGIDVECRSAVLGEDCGEI